MPERAGEGRLYAGGLRERLTAHDVCAPIREALGRFSQDDVLNRQLYADLSVYLADDILVKVDRMAMATSLGARAPFSMPTSWSWRSRCRHDSRSATAGRRWVLKQAMKVLPDAILARKKEGQHPDEELGCGAVAAADAGPSCQRIASVGAPCSIPRRSRACKVEDHVTGHENHAHTLFPLMVFERWATEHLSLKPAFLIQAAGKTLRHPRVRRAGAPRPTRVRRP